MRALDVWWLQGWPVMYSLRQLIVKKVSLSVSPPYCAPLAQKDQGINPKREAKVNPRKGRERIRTQAKNYQCFKQMYDRGWIAQARPLLLHKRRAIIPLGAQEAVIQEPTTSKC